MSQPIDARLRPIIQPTDISILPYPNNRPVNVFANQMQELLATLLSGFTGNNYDPKLKVTGKLDPLTGLGRMETSIFTDPKTQVRLLQNRTNTHADMRSIVSRTLDDGTVLTSTSAGRTNSKGERIAYWYRTTAQSTLGENTTTAKDTLAKLFNINNIDKTKDVQVTNEAKWHYDKENKVIGHEYSKTIKYKDKDGKEHEQKVTVFTNEKGEQQKVEMTMDGKAQALPANAKLLASYVQKDVSDQYEDNHAVHDELYRLGDFGLFTAGEKKVTTGTGGSGSGSGNDQDLKTLVQLLKQILSQFSGGGFANIQEELDLRKLLSSQDNGLQELQKLTQLLRDAIPKKD